MFFRVDETCVGRHFNERRPWARNGESLENLDQQLVEQQAESTDPVSEGYNASMEDLEITEKEEEYNIHTMNQPASAQEENSKANSSENESDEQFPDTVIEVANTDKYNLSVLNESQTESCEESLLEAKEAKPTSASRHLSAKQRRDLKKNGQIIQNSRGSVASSEKSSRTDESAPTLKPLPRGKKGKIKKMKEKYGEQDEEDRELITKFLGAALGPQPKGKKAKAQAARKARLEELQKEREKQKSEVERQKPQTPTKDDSQEIQKILLEENIALPDDDQVGDLTYLDSLTGQPHPDDILLFSIPVCAPWIALQKFKYKVKLTPGSLKKGKAAKSALSSFIAVGSGADGRDKELELIRSIQENELIMQILAKVKISGEKIRK